jgi:tRNA-2-methylthio-N6-dimethylallyladenosine synthase
MRRISFDSAFIFKYSPRPPAKAAALRDNVPADTKQRRLKRLLDMQCAISLERNKPYAGRTVEVLVDGKNTKEPGCVTGRSRTSKVVIFKGDEGFIGRTVSVKVESVSPHGLRGRME